MRSQRSRPAPVRPARPTRRTVLAAALIAMTPLAAACGSSSTGTGAASPAASSSPAEAPNAFPVTVTGANGEVTLDAAPEKIVVLGPTLTETLFAIGAGTQVEAVDDQSTYPTDAPKTDLSAFKPNAEAVAKYSPDLVMLTNDSNGLVDALGALKVPTLVLAAPQDLAGAYDQMLTVGKVTGHTDDAQKLVDSTKQKVQAAVDSAPASVKGKKVYHELDPTFYSATSSTFIGDVYSQFGLTNIADAAKGAADSGGYPQLSAEYIVSQAPDLIVLADTKCCQQTLETVAARPGFGNLPAVRNGAVLAADDDIASRWGPRVVDFAEQVAAELAKVK